MSKRKSVEDMAPITMNPGDSIDERIPHHDKDGSINPKTLHVSIMALEDGTIKFVGPYHDTRHKQAVHHLADHLEDLPAAPTPSTSLTKPIKDRKGNRFQRSSEE